jgi:MFS family permease
MENMKQNRFWNRDYSLMCLCNFLLCASVFLQFPIFRQWATENAVMKNDAYLCAAVFAVGMFLPGPFNAFLVDAFRRKRVCYVAIWGLIATSAALTVATTLPQVTILRLLEGISFGILQMALGGTLINDLSVSSKRTLTDSYYLWFGRLSFPLGILGAWYISALYKFDMALYGSIILQLAGFLFLCMVRVSFHAPNRTPLISLDRFWQPHALLLVVNLLPVAVIQGQLLGGLIPPLFIGMFGGGLLLAFVTHRTFFEEADCRADAVAGLILISSAMLLLLLQHETRILSFAFALLGIGLGWFNSRFFLYFLKLSGHCQRGTLQQTFVLTSMLGMCIGFVITVTSINQYLLALILGMFSLVLYLLVTHRWFQKNKDRNFKFREV